MFTGIIETLGKIENIEKTNGNIDLYISSNFTNEVKIDQSVAHNGICLTVVEINENIYKVTAIEETINKTTIANWKIGDEINLERGMKLNDRLDGHIVQGHIDQIAKCIDIKKVSGSVYFHFEYVQKENTTIEKGSITVDGTSLTVVDSNENTFSVAIIPYTYNNTLFKKYQIGTEVNIEFDVIGKYVSRLMNIKK